MQKVNRRIAALVIGLAGISALPLESSAQNWPKRTVRVIVPLPPGTAIDVSARIVAEHLSGRWAQPVAVENIAGADGILARIMHHSAHFCTSARRTRAAVRSDRTGVPLLAMQRVWG